MSESVLFHIKNLKCAYNDQKKVVLNIKELIIPRGQIVFILGSSGSGKSTLLETLGLMNNTFQSGDIRFFSNPESNSDFVDFSKIWSEGNERLNQIRKANFSFIFQQTNLMENFTAYENVCMSEMIKEGNRLDETLSQAKNLMNRVGLTENEVKIDKMSMFLSGGQRQRLSFVRALSNKANVLFCDEPTGNLDETNANELFQVIREEANKGRSAIIVSHDINLALKHADQIIVLTKNDEKGYGELLLNNIFERKSWESKSEIELLQFKNTIKNLFSSKEQTIKSDSTEVAYNYYQFDFFKLFKKRETFSLRGKSARNFSIVSVILVFTFLAIGFANGSLKYMDKTMNSSFVNYISFPVPTNLAGKGPTEDLVKKLSISEYKNLYKYKTVSPIVLTGFDCFAFKQNNYKQKLDTITSKSASSRSVDIISDQSFLVEEVLSKKNIVRGVPNKLCFKSNNDLSVIVTSSFLKDFGYPENTSFIDYSYFTSDTTGGQKVEQVQPLPIAIAAVVKELPGKRQIIFPIGLHAVLDNDATHKCFSYFKDLRLIKFFVHSEDKNDFSQIQNTLNSQFKKDIENHSVTIRYKADTLGMANGAMFEFELFDEVSNYRIMDAYWNRISIVLNAFVKQGKLLRYPVLFEPDFEYKDTYQSVSIFFKELDKIDEFSKFLKDQNESDSEDLDKFQLDMTKVKEKKNYLFLSNVSIITSIFLVFFSTAAISLFIYFLLSAHLNKVKMNIGTFLAIGLSTNQSRKIYFSIILQFMLSALILSACIALSLGELINYMIKMNVKSDDDMKYFEFFDWITLLTFFIVLLTSLFVSRFTIRKILFKSPGDLVYNR